MISPRVIIKAIIIINLCVCVCDSHCVSTFMCVRLCVYARMFVCLCMGLVACVFLHLTLHMHTRKPFSIHSVFHADTYTHGVYQQDNTHKHTKYHVYVLESWSHTLIRSKESYTSHEGVMSHIHCQNVSCTVPQIWQHRAWALSAVAQLAVRVYFHAPACRWCAYGHASPLDGRFRIPIREICSLCRVCLYISLKVMHRPMQLTVTGTKRVM